MSLFQQNIFRFASTFLSTKLIGLCVPHNIFLFFRGLIKKRLITFKTKFQLNKAIKIYSMYLFYNLHLKVSEICSLLHRGWRELIILRIQWWDECTVREHGLWWGGGFQPGRTPCSAQVKKDKEKAKNGSLWYKNL